MTKELSMSNGYISVFSGIGGLEHPSDAPLLFCEQDKACQEVLRLNHPNVPVIDDVREIQECPRAGLVVGGWPCQDISSAGTLSGIHGKRSGLFFEMLRVAKLSRSHTLIGENVPNLLTINEGADFKLVLDALEAEGYSYVSWRVLNARQFGLPQERRRLFIVASRHRERAEAIHSIVPVLTKNKPSREAFGFYWTGGKRSICWSKGYVPTLKIGAADNNGRSPVAVLFDGQLRKLSPGECLRLQGFDEWRQVHQGISRSAALRMSGNAVPRPMGHFVVKAVSECLPMDGLQTSFGIVTDSGLIDDGLIWSIANQKTGLAANLSDFLDPDVTDSLSGQAAAGLLLRSIRAQQPMPLELFDMLFLLSGQRDGPLRPSRANSFEGLDAIKDERVAYRNGLISISKYREPTDNLTL